MSGDRLAIKTRDKTVKSNWELEQRIFCVEHYFRSGSFKQVHNLFCKQFNTDTVPHKTCIQKWVLKFRKYGTLSNLPNSTESHSSISSSHKKMSNQKGNVNRSRSQKHQNSKAFKNDKYDKSKMTKVLNSLEITDVCERCKSILEWKVKYKKYKVLKQAAVCTKCKGKVITKSYRTVCGPCAKNFKICPKCNKPESEWNSDTGLTSAHLPNLDEEEDQKSSGDEESDEALKDDADKNEGWRGWLST